MSDSSVIRREKTELYVGLFVIVGLAIMGLLIWQFGRISDKFNERYEVFLRLPDATGLVLGAEVRFSGQRVGYISERQLLDDYSGVRLKLDIFKKFTIPEASEFTISTSGLMGDKFINIIPPEQPTEVAIKPGAEIYGTGTDVVGDLTARVEQILDKLDVAVDETRIVVANVTSVTEKLDRGIMSESNVENISTTLSQLNLTTENLSSASSKLSPLLDEAQVTVKTAAEPFDRATEMIEKLDPTVEELRSTVKNANRAIEKITDGDGVTGALISDAELREDLESFVANLEEHGILGYKGGKKRNDAYEDDDSSSSGSDSKDDDDRRGWGPFRKK